MRSACWAGSSLFVRVVGAIGDVGVVGKLGLLGVLGMVGVLGLSGRLGCPSRRARRARPAWSHRPSNVHIGRGGGWELQKRYVRIAVRFVQLFYKQLTFNLLADQTLLVSSR